MEMNRALTRGKLCAFQEISRVWSYISVHAWRTMSWIVKKKANTLAYECADIPSCVAMRAATVPQFDLKLVQDSEIFEMQSVNTSRREARLVTTRPNKDRQTQGWALCADVSHRWAQVTTPRTHHWTRKRLCRVLHCMVVSSQQLSVWGCSPDHTQVLLHCKNKFHRLIFTTASYTKIIEQYKKY